MINTLPINFPIPHNLIVNADDLGLNKSVNDAILFCFNKGYINSTSLLTNTGYFEDTLNMIYNNPVIQNIGLHVNLAEGKPVSKFNVATYLDDEGNWDIKITSKIIARFNSATKLAFIEEINAQIEKALSAKIPLVHLDSHYHLHTLPCFYNLFLEIAVAHGLKIRLAQTYYENSYVKFLYRKHVNAIFKKAKANYSSFFESVNHFLNSGIVNAPNGNLIEIMLHPYFDLNGNLSDHYDHNSIVSWLGFLNRRVDDDNIDVIPFV